MPEAQYLSTPRSEFLLIDAEHKNLVILSKGAFREVYKALNIKDRKQVAIKVLNEGEGREMNEFNIMSNLCYMSSFIDVCCISVY